jgi:hypothetical protein
MYDLAGLSEAEVAKCGGRLEACGAGAPHMEDAANKIVRHLYENLTDEQTGQKACAMVRFYKTHRYSELDPGLQEFARGILGDVAASPEMRCLTLLATAGEESEWNSRANSAGHKAIPLPSEDFVAKIPMIARLINQLGLELSAVLKPDPAIMVDLQEKTYNVFHVPEAVGSPYIPAQNDFVIPHGVRSVVGFGGVLPSGELYVVILFAKVQIPRATADRFKALAANVKTAVAPFAGKAVFAGA